MGGRFVRTLIRALCFSAVSCSVSPLPAELITHYVSGTVFVDNPPTFEELGTFGDTMTGSFSFGEPTIDLLPEDPDAAEYELAGNLEVNINGYVFGGQANVIIANDLPGRGILRDIVTLWAYDPSGFGVEDDVFIQLSFTDTTATVFSDASLPSRVSLDDFDYGSITLTVGLITIFEDGSWSVGAPRQLASTIETLVVPEPSSLALACMALLGGLFAWRVRVPR